MVTIKGLAVSTGIAIGRARYVKEKDLFIPDNLIQDFEVETNLLQFESSIKILIKEIDEYINNFDLSDEDENILETHKMILIDPELDASIRKLVRDERKNLEHAVYLHFTNAIEYFQSLDNELYADRAIDYEDVYKRLIMHLKKTDNSILNDVMPGDIVLMNNIPPSMVSQLYNKKVEGIVLFKGTKTSHSVIIARALGLPIVTGIKFAHKIYKDDMLIIDAMNGTIVLRPNEETINKFKTKKEIIENEKKELSGYNELSASTVDCERVLLLSNIELPVEITQVLGLNTDGIGLFRTEFFYLNRQNLPSEDEQFFEYKAIAQKLSEKQFTIRTIDIGGDKVANWQLSVKELNPYLGCRGIRFSFRIKSIFKTQLRAILRASIYGNIQVMFPMIASIEEFLEAKEILQECKKELSKENIRFNDSILVGTMIEIPSAAMYSDILAQYSDFFSIGTNDLLQYTVAVDRNNESVAKYYNPYTPAFLQLLYKATKSATKHNKPVTICGELANDLNFTAFLLCLGVKELSVGAEHILTLKKHIRGIDVKQGNQFVSEISNCFTIKDTENFIKKINNICLYNNIDRFMFS